MASFGTSHKQHSKQYQYIEENGVYGVRIFGPNGHSIFLPVCGYGLWYGMPDPFDRTSAAYWTGVDYPEYDYNGNPIEPSLHATSMSVDIYGGYTAATSPKAYGLSIRAVVRRGESGATGAMSDTDKAVMSFRDGCIRMTGGQPDGTARVYDHSGRLVFQDSVSDGICRLNGVPSGVYIATYDDHVNTAATLKIIIK